MSDELTREVRRREQGPTAVSDALAAAVGGLGEEGRRGAGASAWIAWNRVNGDIERAHSTGVYVGEPRRGAVDPELTVYVDSHSFITDFSANREVYLARLETVGLRFSNISFRLSKTGTRKNSQVRKVSTPQPRKLPELSPGEESEVERLTAELPDALRESVSRAMRVSYRAQKQEHS